jgi:NDP-sugar pyrophosphorylase family protein
MKDLFDADDPSWAVLALTGLAPWELLLNVPAVINTLRDLWPRAANNSPKVHFSAVVTESLLGEGVRVYEGCTVRESVIFPNTVIGHASEVARSIILPNCMIPRFNYVGSSLLGSGVNLGGSTQLASMRYDLGDVRLCLSSNEIETGATKYGSLVGDGVRIAYGCHVNPGSVIGRNSTIGPHIDWRGYCSPDSYVFLRQRTFTSRRRGPGMFARGEYRDG